MNLAEKAAGMAPLVDNFDIFIDLSRHEFSASEILAYLLRLRQQSGLLTRQRPVTLACPQGRTVSHPDVFCSEDSPGALLAGALSAAGAARRGLLIVQGGWIPANEVVLELVALQDADAMIGMIQPRFATALDDRVVCLPGVMADGHPTMHRSSLRYLPKAVLTPELVAPLLLIAPRGVLAAEAKRADDFESVLTAMLVGLRRRGFRNLVCNAAVATGPFDPARVYGMQPSDNRSLDPNVQKNLMEAQIWMRSIPEIALEAVLQDAFTADGRAKLLLDCRGMQDFYNGTTKAVLGYLSGLAQLETPGLEITLLLRTDAVQFHRLAERFPNFIIQVDAPEGGFLAAIALDQLWHVETFTLLHRHAVFVAINMLDTIAWDIVYAAPKGLDRTWRLMAMLADGFLFISSFSKDRFIYRFPTDPAMPLVVSHLSLDPDEYGCAEVIVNRVIEPYILLFGNKYDHKGVDWALRTLIDAFPYQKIIVFGATECNSNCVTHIASGHISEGEIEEFIANALAIVYPSFYEGFGFPVVQGLAYGKTVIVRDCALWPEVADHGRFSGRLLPYTDDLDLVVAVGGALHGSSAAGLPFGSALPPGERAQSWSGTATRLVDLLDDLMVNADSRPWLRRQVVLSPALLDRGA